MFHDMWLLPGYRADGVIGLGPDGPVHRVVPDRLGSLPVALRVAAVPAGPQRRRLRQVAETIAALGHPALALVHDVVDVDDDRVAIVSTLGTHGSLADRLALGPLPAGEAVALAHVLAQAVASAHGLGLVHGRISATNVVLGPDGPLLCDLALGHIRTTTDGSESDDDVGNLVRLCVGLLAPDDDTAPAAALRSLCRSAPTSHDLHALLAALDRLRAAPPAPTARTTPSAPRAAAPRGAPAPAAALVVGASLTVGALLGMAGTLLPIG